jgi:hypothetical protein
MEEQKLVHKMSTIGSLLHENHHHIKHHLKPWPKEHLTAIEGHIFCLDNRKYMTTTFPMDHL